jgi:protein-disulfide isomerase
METKETKKDGVYLSNFVAMGLAVFILGLAFASGFFAKAYFTNTVSNTTTNGAVAGDKAAQVTVSLKQIKDIFNQNVIKFGDANSKVLFVEASDPSCPYCNIAAGKNGELNTQAGANFTLVKDGGTYEAPVEEIRKLVDAGQASYAYIYRPGHGNGEMAMKALYCAFDAGKFWQVHDLLMSGEGYNLINNTVKNDKTKTDTLVEFLSTAMDASALKACMDSGKYDSRLQSDTALTDSLGVGGTPAFFVNDKLFAGAYSFKDIRPTVDAFLK